ncbi:hypothetical protein VTJ83DRAFT_1927 [Remersonia thermophila]|uniref:F-box domain-containing protein n=1 Tax=Remersonia thermophila TaxID=72144 RepID=A0ABR4DHA3_9PEZI
MRFFRRKDKGKGSVPDKADGGRSHRLPVFGSRRKNSAPTNGGGGGGGGGAYYGTSDVLPHALTRDASHGSAISTAASLHTVPTRRSAELLARLPSAVFERIFTFVCPHARDESYATCEQSAVEDACMLCSLRDLAHCVAVCRQWRAEAVKLLYHSIRIDSVHYCELEAILADRRKRRSFFDRNGEPEDSARARLKLLCRTLREDPVRRGRLVHFLKMPYMLRESCQADLARTIAVTPNLRYVDLPEGLFADDPAFMTLRLEVQARCLELRKMTYTTGSEPSLQALATGRVWPKLEVLELIRIDMEPAMMRHVLGCLVNLRALKISHATSWTDESLAWNDLLPPFPALEELILTDVPNVTAEGLKAWLSALPEARKNLRVLTLNSTGVHTRALPELLAYAPSLKHLSVTGTVTSALPTAGAQAVPPLASASLESLLFEISPSPQVPKYASVVDSYYHYLASSLLSGALPNLRAVYVRYPSFPDLLLLGLPPPAPAFAEGKVARPSSSGGLSASWGGGNSGGWPSFSPPAAPFAAGRGGGGGGGHRPQQSSISSLNSFTGMQQQSLAAAAAAPNPRFSSNNPFASLASSAAMNAGGGLGAAPGPALSGQPGFPLANMALPAKLEVFTKGDDDQLGWSFAVEVGAGEYFQDGRIGGGGADGRPCSRGGGGGGAGERPLSSYGLGADVLGGSGPGGWSIGAGARRSVLVSNGSFAGGFPGAGSVAGSPGGGGAFLAVPNEMLGGGGGGGGGSGGAASSFGARKPRWENLSLGAGGTGGAGGFGLVSSSSGAREEEWPRPRSSAGERKREKMDLWR